MAQLEINDKQVNVDDKTAQLIKNDVNLKKIHEYLEKYWTPKKLGKHHDMAEKHEEIIKNNLKCNVDDFFKDLSKTTFEPGNKGPYNLHSILGKTSLIDDLQPQYIDDCLKVTTTQPAIGKGEFLFAASFTNIGFAKEGGDLVDLKSGKKIECKGVGAILGNGQNPQLKQMRKSVMNGIRSLLETNDVTGDGLDSENANLIKKLIGTDTKKMKKFFLLTQNLDGRENEGIANQCVKVYLEKKYLLKTIAAAHLYIYMNVEENDYMLMLNGQKFMMFEKPKSVAEAYEIVEHFDISGWKEKETGVKVTLK